MLLSLNELGSSVSGTLTVEEGQLVGSSLELSSAEAGVSGSASRSTLTLTSGSNHVDVTFKLSDGRNEITLGYNQSSGPAGSGSATNIAFERGTVSQFHQLISKDKAHMLATAVEGADRAAESNLTNAMTEAKALYQVYQSYGTDTRPYAAADFEQQAPEFTWSNGTCRSATCVSVQVLDLDAPGDRQAIVLAVLSPGSGTCWYALDAEVIPSTVEGDRSSFNSVSGGPNSGVKSAGVFYGTSPAGVKQTSCTASAVLNERHKASWGDDYSDAGSVG
jgi:hypothetical protein